MSTKTLAPRNNVYPFELPVVTHERRALALHGKAIGKFLTTALALVGTWLSAPAQAIAREPRQSAMQPHRPKAEVLHELGLERFLNQHAV